MLRASLGKGVHIVKRAGAYAAKVPPQELHKIAVRVRAVTKVLSSLHIVRKCVNVNQRETSLGKGVHIVKRAGAYAAKVPPQELHKIAVRVRAVTKVHSSLHIVRKCVHVNQRETSECYRQ